MGCHGKRLLALVLGFSAEASLIQEAGLHHVHNGHHGHHHHHHRHHHGGNATHGHKAVSEDASTTTVGLPPVAPEAHQQQLAALPPAGVALAAAKPADGGAAVPDEQIVQKMRALEVELGSKEQAAKEQSQVKKGRLEVNAPLPEDFPDKFAAGVSAATGCSPNDVRLVGAVPVASSEGSLDEIVFEADEKIISAVEDQAADPDSKLANGPLHFFLVQRDLPEQEPSYRGRDANNAIGGYATTLPPDHFPVSYTVRDVEGSETHPGFDYDASMPYGELEPFGREDTAQELTESSIRESDAMVDQLERAEVAEEKRAIFRALTRLRGAAITSYDGIARSQTGQLDEYNRDNHWRKVHPLRHLADEESDVRKWAFPNGAGDF